TDMRNCTHAFLIRVHECTSILGLGAAWKVADISKQSTVVIFGLGTVGLSVALGAKLRGASHIIGVDTNSDKFEKARLFGITDLINPTDHEEPIHQVFCFFRISFHGN
ncbi:hypothetical protein SOVF_194700, partial [Spinacia oleracea]